MPSKQQYVQIKWNEIKCKRDGKNGCGCIFCGLLYKFVRRDFFSFNWKLLFKMAFYPFKWKREKQKEKEKERERLSHPAQMSYSINNISQ